MHNSLKLLHNTWSQHPVATGVLTNPKLRERPDRSLHICLQALGEIVKLHYKIKPYVSKDGMVQTNLANAENLWMENTLTSQLNQQPAGLMREDIGEYVAHLQLHMTLQARNLIPALTQTKDSREQLLQQTQANFEKYVSRQAL